MNHASQLQAQPYAKWKEAARLGWQPLPNVLLQNQAKLDLSATDMLVLINILSRWWFVDQKPYPRITSIAKRMDVSPRTVQRSLQKLIERNFLKRTKESGPSGEERLAFDPQGLVDVLSQLAIKDRDYQTKQRKDGPDGFEQAPF